MLLALLTAAAVAPAPNTAARYDVFLGMTKEMGAGIKGMITAMGEHWTPGVEETLKIGADTLVMWSWPLKGNHGIGLQIYGPDGKFKTRLKDSNIPSARAVVCQNRYVVGGGNTLRVWDAAQNDKLTARKTFLSLSQFATLSCNGNLLTATDSGASTRVMNVLVPSLGAVNLRFGLSAAAVAALNRSTLNHLDDSHTVTQTLSTPAGETLVAWARTAGYDPKGPRGVGVQIYGADGKFKAWLKDSAFERPLALCGRYLVGGDNTLRVWDTAANFRQVERKTFSTDLAGVRGAPKCQGNVLSVTQSVLRLQLPALTPVR